MRDKVKEIRESWFKNHEVKITEFELDGWNAIIDWRNPNDCYFAVRYIIILGGILYVSGDIGEAVYKWYNPISLPSLATFNLDYFSEKCTASPTGPGFLVWNRELVVEQINEVKKDRIYDAEYSKYEIELAAKKAMECVDTQEYWCEFLGYNIAFHLFGSEPMEFADAGLEPEMRCLAHLEGLKMIQERLKKRWR